MFTGPGEVIFGLLILLSIKITFGLGDFDYYIRDYVPVLARTLYYVVVRLFFFNSG